MDLLDPFILSEMESEYCVTGCNRVVPACEIANCNDCSGDISHCTHCLPGYGITTGDNNQTVCVGKCHFEGVGRLEDQSLVT